MNTSRRWMNLMRFSLNVAVSLQTIWIRSERTPFSNGGHSTTRNRPKLAQKGSAKPFMRKAYETFILESFKGKRSGIPRASRKRGGKAAKRGLSAEQIPVIVARDRSGATIDAVLPKLNRASITAALGGAVTPANQFCCDGGTAIVAFALKAAIPVHILAAPGKPSPQVPDF